MKIACDFDGTLAKRNGIPTKQEELNDLVPMEGGLETLRLLEELGHEVYIYTSNDMLAVREILVKWGFPKIQVVNRKLKGTQVYIDDRAIRFTDWQDIRKYFS